MRTAITSTPMGFWGPPTSTIDWCESNYTYNYYIAEFWNTVSNLLFVLLGLYGLYRSIKMGFEPRFHLQFIGVMVTGFGSAMFHGTLQHVYQQCDETPMVWSILAWIYTVYNNEIEQIPIKNANNYVIVFLTTIGVMFTAVHAIYRFTTVFQLFFGILASLACARLCMYYTEVTDPPCKSSSEGHAWWHIFMGISSYYGPIFMQYVRMEQLKKKAYIQDTCVGFQTIVVEDIGFGSPPKAKQL
ncbi:unnamed protein product [Peronospora belbahrii]|uniref:Alkaline phytoceramidase n=1 Tax=Peronospora belbahrii TaxID=622444 RepID=A0AAU9KS56_9STRA|nr:unnamed protein product [Peronospora belbahrii]